MKRFIIFLLCAAMIFSLSACSEKTTEKTETSSVANENEKITETSENDAFVPAPAAGGAVAPAEDGVSETKTVYQLVLTGIGFAKLEAVKLVKEVTGWNLKDAKYLVDDVINGGSRVIKEFDTMEEAEEVNEKFYDIGCYTEIKESTK